MLALDYVIVFQTILIPQNVFNSESKTQFRLRKIAHVKFKIKFTRLATYIMTYIFLFQLVFAKLTEISVLPSVMFLILIFVFIHSFKVYLLVDLNL